MTLPSLRSKTWDELWLGGAKFPGIASLGWPGIKRKLDVKNPKGAAGATIQDEGDELGQIDITLVMISDEQVAEFMALLPDISPRRKGGPKSPLEIAHPLATAAGIINIYIDQIPILDHDKRAGTLTAKFHAYEWVPRPKPVKGKGGGAGGSPKGGEPTTDDITSEIQNYLDKVTEEFNQDTLEGIKQEV